MGDKHAAKNSEGLGVADIVQRLEEEIALGLLRPRERLVEDDLLARFNVKRHVIRQVLVELELMGMVTRRPNRGAAVRDFTTIEIEQIYFVRDLLERAAVEVMPLPVPVDVLRKLEDLHARHCAAVTAGRLRQVFRLNLEFHQTFFDACGNRPLTEAISQFAFRAHAIQSYAIADPKLLARVCKEHAQLIKLTRGTDRQALSELVAKHKQPAKMAYIEVSRRIEGHIENPPQMTRATSVAAARANGASGLPPSRTRKQ
ncbi:MAG TPA: GntR family transcriptional regulator [Casimicrobiaceae bacterium]|nr:GntR family transcriptional regulator [Casimicrobiaceae bacterium]